MRVKAETYSPAQRQAVVTAINEHGMSGRQAVEAMSAGQLPVDPCDMPHRYALELAAKARAREAIAATKAAALTDPRAALDDVIRRQIAIVSGEVTRLESQQRCRPVDLKKAQALAGIVKNLHAVVNTNSRPPADDDSPSAEPARSALIAAHHDRPEAQAHERPDPSPLTRWPKAHLHEP